MTLNIHSPIPNIRDTLVYRFYLYIIARYGKDTWNQIISQSIYGRSLSDLVHERGDSAFQSLVHVTMKTIRASYSSILKDFNQYPPRSHSNLTAKYG